jgi:hypothetical protein
VSQVYSTRPGSAMTRTEQGDRAARLPHHPSYGAYAAAMKVVQAILLVLHLLGVLALLVGLLVQVRHPAKRVTGPMRDGIWTTVLAGLLMVLVLEIRDAEFDHARVAVMFGIGLLVLVLVMAGARRPAVPTWLWGLVLALTLGDIGVAYAL